MVRNSRIWTMSYSPLILLGSKGNGIFEVTEVTTETSSPKPCGSADKNPGDLCDMDVLRIHPSLGIGGILPLVFRASAFHLCFVFCVVVFFFGQTSLYKCLRLTASVRKQRCCFFGGLRFGLRNIGCSRPTNRQSWLRSPQYKGAVYLW